VVIKDTRSRWGSCSSNNNINYSWRISLAPIEVIRYLVAHEVSHLKYQDHSPEFWQCVKSLERRTTHSKNWLRDNGRELYSY
jgi:predicted metal-dependent hydrolase